MCVKLHIPEEIVEQKQNGVVQKNNAMCKKLYFQKTGFVRIHLKRI